MNDLISRKWLVECVNEGWIKFDTEKDENIYVHLVRDIAPSAQPEIIMCKDCKWYGRADKRRFYRGTDCLNHRIGTIVPDKDYCSRAERRTDE